MHFNSTIHKGGALVIGSVALMAMIAKWEPAKDPGLVYADWLADGLPTVCNGITHHVSPYPVVVGERWSADKCAAAQAYAVERLQRELLPCFTVRITQGQFDGFSSFAWNVGISAACGSYAVRLTNRGDAEGGCRAIGYRPDGTPNWSYAAGRFIRGLFNRRIDEVKMCMRDLTGV